MTTKANKLRILLVEDDADSAIRTEALIFALGYELLPTINNSEDAVRSIRAQQPDVLVMDIDIEGELNGIQVVEQVKDLQIPVIFVTGSDQKEYYDKARQTQPVAFLVKPVNNYTFQTALENAVVKLSKDEADQEEIDQWADGIWLKNSFFIKRNNLLQKIKVEDIHYIQSDGNYCDIISSKKFAVKTSLTQIIKKLPPHQFVRIHKRYIIQADLIESIDLVSNEVYISGVALPLGPKYKEQIVKIADRL